MTNSQQKIIKKIEKVLKKHWERKSWNNDFSGRATTPEEDEMGMLLTAVLLKFKK